MEPGSHGPEPCHMVIPARRETEKCGPYLGSHVTGQDLSVEE